MEERLREEALEGGDEGTHAVCPSLPFVTRSFLFSVSFLTEKILKIILFLFLLLSVIEQSHLPILFFVKGFLTSDYLIRNAQAAIAKSAQPSTKAEVRIMFV